MTRAAGGTRAWVRALDSVAAMAREPGLTLPVLLERVTAAHPDRPALIGPDASLSYAALAARVRRVARWAATLDGPIGLQLPNGAALVALWLGVIRADRVAALLSPHLGGDLLAHAMAATGCTRLITAADLAALERLDDDGPIPDAPADPAATALLVTTSGTTGLPKAARISHGRVLEWALWFAGLMDVAPQDRIYDCLPLTHSTGGVVAIGAALARGAAVQIAPGFSARRFWDDVAAGGCTISVHIGELCRYLLAAPPHPRERAHRLRLACGNGLQAGVWQAFQARFGVETIIEFYAATEGSVSLYNVDGEPGAIGRIPPFLRARFPFALIRVDADSGAPLRGPAGLCVPCGAGEVGEALGRVDHASPAPSRRFDGYTDAAATEAKLLADVLAPGHCWFRSGDLMRQDARGFLYFVDRMGDTFRWKGENVSTTEVAATVRAAPGVADALVYGVRVAGAEGRAGMAAVVPAPGFDPAALWAALAATLPAHAQPVFVRLCAALELTGTLKLSAVRLARDGFAGVADPVLVSDRAQRRYVPLDPATAAAIAAGEHRL